MDVKEVVKLSKQYVSDLFRDENLTNLGLEEIEYDDAGEIWYVTLGFSRPWDRDITGLGALTGAMKQPFRAYRVVKIRNTDGEVLSVKLRDLKNGDVQTSSRCQSANSVCCWSDQT